MSIEMWVQQQELAGSPASFEQYMDYALYGPMGYYTKSVSIGYQGADFYTSASSYLFGATIAEYIRKAWRDFGAPRRLQIVEMGAGQGELAKHISQALSADPVAAEVRYVIIEKSARMRAIQRVRLGEGTGYVTVDWDRPSDDIATVFIANELLDALPVHLLRLTSHGFESAYVVAGDGGLTVEWYPAPEDLEGLADRWLPIRVDSQGELCLQYHSLFELLGTFGNPLKALFIDYGITKMEWAEGLRPMGTLRGYLNHQVVHPLKHPGQSDITADVYWDFVVDAAHSAGFSTQPILTQGQFLMHHGVLRIAEQSQSREGPGVGVRPSRVANQLKQLVLPGGMGERFAVLECGLRRDRGEEKDNVT